MPRRARRVGNHRAPACVQPHVTIDEVRDLLRLMGMLEHAEMRSAGGASRAEAPPPELEHSIESDLRSSPGQR